MRRPRASYANVTATLALVVALGAGGAYAAGLGRNEVKSKNIAPKAVKTSDLGKGAVKTAKIAGRAVTGAKIAKDTVTGTNVAEATLSAVPNSDLLDGLDSSAFLRGTGQARAVFGFDKEGGQPSVLAGAALGNLALECRNPASVGSALTFTNTSGGTVDVWTDKIQDGFAPETRVNHAAVPNGGSAGLEVPGPDVLSGTDILRFTIVGGNRLTLVEARMVFDGPADGCRVPLLITELSG
jgi:hypothetical protein